MMRTGTVLRYLKKLTILHSHPIGMGARACIFFNHGWRRWTQMLRVLNLSEVLNPAVTTEATGVAVDRYRYRYRRK